MSTTQSAAIGIIGVADGPTAIFVASNGFVPQLLSVAAALAIGYLLGSLMFGIIVSKGLFHDDVRSHGSGNAGSTNILRTYGKGAAALALAGDMGKGVLAVITVGLVATIVESLTGFVLIPGLAPIEEGFYTVGNIALVLAGAFPLVYTLTKVLRKPLMALGKALGVNEVAAAGLLATLANSIATFGLVKDMDHRGKVVNMAFAVSAAFVFGDHLGFAAGFAPELLPAVIVGKLVGGVTSVAVAVLLTRKKT